MVSTFQARDRWRRGVRVRGAVQGVGFRPAMFRAAAALALGGFVRNDDQGVLIEIEGDPEVVGRFLRELPRAAPPAARIESLETTALPPLGEERFRIAGSTASPGRDAGTPRASIPPDLGPCVDCLRELEDGRDRRAGYPFINCTACGPRFSIVRRLPYDRFQTTMAPFTLCADCRREYEDPLDRRFHAEPNACPACGPRLSLVVPGGLEVEGAPALGAARRLLRAGRIVAVKGAGGFVLAVDATDAAAVERLRARKRRPSKPLAVMGRSLEALERVVTLDGAARACLISQARPIVLQPLKPGAGIAPNVAPRLRELGVFLPATPLQHLLFGGEVGDEAGLLVMTSGNLSEEPIARTDDEARARLGEIADAFLLHDREIHTRVDDSVLRIVSGQPRVLRRARGFVPEPIALPFEGPPVLAVGAESKTTVCMTRGGEAILSQHLGDLLDVETFSFFEETVAKLAELAGVRPAVVAHDLHPEYRATRWARQGAAGAGLPLVPVQHHHAHVASCLVDNGRTGPVIGVAFDGTGLGPDGTLWGGEILVADLAGFQRRGHLRALPLAGGEAAIREPWRIAVAALVEAGVPPREPLAAAGIDAGRVDLVTAVLARPRLALRAHGAGRWFDAVAALAGVRAVIDHDGQAAAELEAAAGAPGAPPYDFTVAGLEPFVIDLRPAIRQIAEERGRGVDPGPISARFHETMAQAIAAACRRVREAGGPDAVALSGGCFQNRRLTEAAQARLEQLGFEVLLHRRVPCNDGGLALGQAAVAGWRSARGGEAAAPCA